jgi:NADPH2:quinone reductase
VGVFGPARGAYATARNVSADLLVPLPEEVDDRTAAAILLKGTTTAFLIEDCAKVQPGWTVLVHAAAGGVGHLAVGWLKAIGATVIGTVGSEAKAERARAAGADHVILNRSEDVAARVRDITGGTGVPVVLDGVGKATWEASLNSAARRGLVVSFGNASGPVDGVNLGILAAKGSLFVTRPTLFDYALTAADKRRLAERVFAMLAKGAIIPEIGQEFPLTDAAEAHRAIEAGETVGSTVLIP